MFYCSFPIFQFLKLQLLDRNCLYFSRSGLVPRLQLVSTGKEAWYLPFFCKTCLVCNIRQRHAYNFIRIMPYYMITAHLTTAKPLHFGCNLRIQTSSVHMNILAFSVEDASLAIGTSQCLKCTNIHLTLLLQFALAGLMLVLFLIVCNLTVSSGTINGLIFYAKIVPINHAFFFRTPATSALKVFQHVLAIFIAWLNLDLGIETCFFNGMDAYIQTWLQFAFPFYIWMIV